MVTCTFVANSQPEVSEVMIWLRAQFYIKHLISIVCQSKLILNILKYMFIKNGLEDPFFRHLKLITWTILMKSKFLILFWEHSNDYVEILIRIKPTSYSPNLQLSLGLYLNIFLISIFGCVGMFQLLQYNALRWIIKEYWENIFDMNLRTL